MNSDRECYVCSKSPAKRCTSCFQIAYCSIACQRADWKYHKGSCLQKTINVIDSLIKLQNFDHIIRNICSYLSGADLHYFGCVKRSWRDVMLEMRSSEIERRRWKNKLTRQWRMGGAEIKEMADYRYDISKMALSGNELFVDVFGKKEIHVYDITTNQFKFKLRTAKGNTSVWDVHKDFLLIFDGKKIYLWDRHQKKEVDIDPSTYMQIGTHYSNGGDSENENIIGGLVVYKNTHPILKDQKNDVPVVIKIFPDIDEKYSVRERSIIIVYKSGLVSRWEYFTPYGKYTRDDWCPWAGEDERYETYEMFKFERVTTSDHLSSEIGLNCALSPCEVLIAQPYHNEEKCWEKDANLFFLVGGCVEFCDLDRCGAPRLASISGVERMYCFYESSTLHVGVTQEDSHYEGYLIIKRIFDTVYEQYQARKQFVKRLYEQGEGNGTFQQWKDGQIVQDDDDQDSWNITYLEVHAVVGFELHHRRIMKIKGNVSDVTMNDQHMVVSFTDQSFRNYIHIYG